MCIVSDLTILASVIERTYKFTEKKFLNMLSSPLLGLLSGFHLYKNLVGPWLLQKKGEIELKQSNAILVIFLTMLECLL